MNKQQAPIRFESLSAALHALGLPSPQHPLIALINGIDQPIAGTIPKERHVLDFYKISFRPFSGGALRYGQTHFDFNEGGLLFAAPNQIIGGEEAAMESMDDDGLKQQITVLIHPDFLMHHPLATKISQYGFFSYSVHEALFLSEKEKETLLALLRTMEDELSRPIDEISQNVIIAQIELLLNYAQRFYKRQFITRKPLNNDLLEQLEMVLNEYFTTERPLQEGIPTVKHIAAQLNLSPGYLSDLLRTLTGEGAQQYIHNKLIEKAKEKLSTTTLSVGEIAYELGFEHPQSFSKLFKSKTRQSPLAFRARFH